MQRPSNSTTATHYAGFAKKQRSKQSCCAYPYLVAMNVFADSSSGKMKPLT